MKRTVVLFESKYGSTRRYARWIAKALDCPLFERKRFHAQDFADYDTIVYGGGLYAGGVSGIRLLTKNWPVLRKKQVYLFTCGLADPENPVNAAHIREALSKVLPPEMMEQIQLFHLRGGIDYSRLSPVHKIMMSMMRRMLLKKDPAALTSEDRQLLDTYGQYVDFTDAESIAPMIQAIRASDR